MSCASCGWESPAGARFCAGCGAALVPRCPACNAESQPGARFCAACGASLAAPAPAPEPAATRKVVTIVFADLIGSTALHERLDPESVSRVMARYHEAVRAPIEAHGGRVVQRLGDGVMCAFGVPRAGEDDALRAVRAGVEVQRSFRAFLAAHAELAGRIGLRVAVNTGEVVVSDDYTAGIGDPLNVAGRLQQEAKDGDVLLGESTQRLVAEQVTLARVGSFALKGRAEPVTAYRVVSLERPAGVAATPFVGRDEELARITAVYEAAIAAPAAKLAVVFGSPGLGKSRLVAELGRRLEGRARVLVAHCNAAGGATFAPLADALRAHFAPDPGAGDDTLRAALDALVPARDAAERAQLAVGLDALLRGTPAQPEEIFFAIRRVLVALAAEAPVVLAIDDLQWAEPLLLDFTEHLVQWGAGVPLLVLAAARPELRETRSAFALPGRLVSEVVTLGGLDAGAAMRLAANVIGAETLPAAVAGRVLTTSEGNPLFVGELVRMLVNDGALQRDGQRWKLAVDVAALAMPPTIQALLAARIERLRPEERLVLERAAVIGRQFSRAAVTELLPREAHAELPARLEALRRSELIEPDPGWLFGEPALRFHHGLIRDAAYRRVLRGTRAELHARFADWLAARASEVATARASEGAPQDETIGWHLEQAHLHLREIGPLDPAGLALGERAARHLGAAGGRALARDDLEPAASLLGRALACLGAEHPDRAGLARDWCEALLAAGEVGPAGAALAELERAAAGSDSLRAWHACFRAELAVLTDPQALRRSADAAAAAAGVLASAGDAAGEAKAHSVHALALSRLGKIGVCEVALDHALAAARRAGDRRRANAVLAGAPLAALFGPSPVTRASGRCLDVVRVLRITQGAPAVEAVALSCQALLETLRGRSEAGRRMIASARRMVEALGNTKRVLDADVFAGRIALLEGDVAAAESSLRAAYEGLRAQGLGSDAAQAAALLGRALLAEGRAAEAEALSHESEALAGDDFAAAIAWRGVRAEALARRGEHAAALELARAAVEIAAATDDLLDHADARSALALVLRAAGRGADADAEAARALALWEQKGATLLVERARRHVAVPAPAERAPRARSESSQPARRVRSNAATAAVSRLDAALAARDIAAVRALVASGAQALQHPIGFSEPALSLYETALGIEELSFRHEPLASLGDSLALFRSSLQGSGAEHEDLHVGPYDLENPVLIESDAEGRCSGAEYFGDGRLGDAIARLYERYAEGMPEGPKRTCAAATARSVAALSGAFDAERYAAVVAPDVELLDRRTLGTLSARGAETVLEQLLSWRAVSDDFADRVDDLLGLRADALLFCLHNTGIGRASGGAYERRFLALWSFGVGGLLTRIELFDTERESEALARFDALGAEPPAARPARRRVRPNAATANAVRTDAVIAARDAGALPTLIADRYEVIDHPTGATFDGNGVLTTWRGLLAAREPTLRHGPLATLGDALLLCRVSTAASGFAGRTFDVGPYQTDRVSLIEVDANGRRRRSEGFAPDRLGDAVTRLYERYAEGLPEGPERTLAAASARLVAVWAGPLDPDGHAAALAPEVEVVDHRTLGTWTLHGKAALVENLRSWLALADDIQRRAEDILALRPGALLARWTHLGTDRTSGGAYERPFLLLWVLGADGLATHWELFEPERAAEALARFDELTAELPAARVAQRRVRPNAATANASRLEAAIGARDSAAIADLYAASAEVMHHPTGVSYDRQGALRGLRALVEGPAMECRQEPIASLGASLALCRTSIFQSGSVGPGFDTGPVEREQLTLVEVDANGRRAHSEVFASERLSEAITRLYELYAERLPEGAARTRAEAIASSAASLVFGPAGIERHLAALAENADFVDHRALVTLPPASGKAEHQQRLEAWFGAGGDLVQTAVDVLDLQPAGLLLRLSEAGTGGGGGAYEIERLHLWWFDAGGLIERNEMFDVDRAPEALARFDALAEPEPPAPRRRPVPPNLATAVAARIEAAVAARDLAAVEAAHAAELEAIDRPSTGTFDRTAMVATYRMLLAARDPAFHMEPLASLGDRLALVRTRVSTSGLRGGDFDVGAYEIERIGLLETDAAGRMRWNEGFASDRLGDAIAALYTRYAALQPEGPERERAAATARTVGAFGAPPSVEGYLPTAATGLKFVDHRALVTLPPAGPEDFERNLAIWLEGSEEVTHTHEDVLALRADGLVVLQHECGRDRATGGLYDLQRLVLCGFDSAGLLLHAEMFDLDQAAEALARFEALAAPAVRRVRPNAATAAAACVDAAVAARDEGALAELLSDAVAIIDHVQLLTYDRHGGLVNYRMLLGGQAPTHRYEPLASLGERLALFHLSVGASGMQGGALDVAGYEVERITVIEVDAAGRMALRESFATEQLGDAVACLYERRAAQLPEGPERARIAAAARLIARLEQPVDPAAWGEVWAPEIETVDHRTLGTHTSRGRDAALENLRSFAALADDLAIRIDDVLAANGSAFLLRARSQGTSRLGGGAFERPFLLLLVVGAQALVTRTEFFDEGREAEALACFEALAAEPPARARRRVRPNTATATAARIEAAVAARDTGPLGPLFADDFEAVDGPMRLRHGREGMLRHFRMLLAAEGPALRYEPLASLGDGLALFRAAFSARGVRGGELDVGGYEHESLQLYEVDAAGRMLRDEGFAPAQLSEAIVRLYERYAERMPEGPEQQSARLTARLIAGLQHPPDPASWGPALAPAVELVDRRILGLGSVQGVDAVLASTRALFDLSETRPTTRFDEVLGSDPRALLVRATNAGTDRATGGAYERQHLLLLEFGAGGRLARVQQLDSERAAEALARFDALVAPVARRVRPNAATANAARLEAAIAGRDMDAVGDCYAEAYESADHAMGGLPSNRAQQVRQFRMLLAAREPLARLEPLATLGDSLVLLHASYSASGFRGGELDVGAYERPSLTVNEVDSAGRQRWSESFAPDRLGAAVLRLYERHAEQLPPGPARDVAAARVRAFATQLVRLPAEGYAGTLAPDVEVVDHRVLGTWAARGPEAVLEQWNSLARLGDDIELAIEDVLRLAPAALLLRGQARGTDRSGGGAFETTPMLAVLLTGSDGRITRMEYFDADREADALVRFDALVGEVAPRENAATRWTRRMQLAFEARDWDGVAALLAPGFRQSDRRRTARMELDREQYLTGLRWLFDVAAPRYTNELLATRGERLALYRALLSGVGPDVGPFESELLALVELDAQGQQIGSATFDPDDLAAAYAELDERYVAGEAAPFPAVATGARAFVAAATARDWDALSALLAPDLVVEDHRRLGWGTLHGPAPLVDSWRALAELAPDVRVRVDHATVAQSASLALFTLLGTREGGAFEDERVVVHVYDANGKICRHEIYSLEQLGAARARLAALSADAPRAPLVSPNAATAAYDREQAAFEARDWAAMRAAFALHARIDDRRSLVGIAVDADQLVADKMRFAEEAEDARYERLLLATFGDRIDLERGVASGGPAGGRFEIEVLTVTEVDESGQIVLRVTFDADAQRAAQREALARLIASGPVAAAALAPLAEFIEGFNDDERARMRAALVDDFVHEDHRQAGVGRIEGVDAYLDSLFPPLGLVRDIQLELLSVRAIERHGAVGRARTFGSGVDGGSFEILLAAVFCVAGGRIARLELFEIDRLDAALARLAELRPDPARIPPNAAWRARDRTLAAWQARDWDAIRALVSGDFVFEDRGRRALVSGDVELWLRSNQFVREESEARLRRELVGTAGERVAIDYTLWSGGTVEAPVEREHLRLTEVDAEGRIRASIRFDLDDRAAAFAEAEARFAAGEAAACGGQAVFLPLNLALACRDWEALRACCADALVVHDHRTLGLDSLPRDAWIESIAAATGIAHDWSGEYCRILAWSGHGRVIVTRAFGTMPDGGGPFENLFVSLLLTDGARVHQLELFDLADADRALARFAELCSASS